MKAIYTKNHSKSILTKAIAICIAVIFLCQNIGWTAPALSGGSISGNTSPITSNYSQTKDIFIPEQYGSVKDDMDFGARYLNHESTSPLVVLIKDAHCNFEAQKNIEQILDVLIRDYKIDLIGVEGASGKVDPSILIATENKEVRQKTADKYIKNGYLTASEALAMTKGKDYGFSIFGIEDISLYLEDLKSYREVYNNSSSAKQFIEKANTLVSQLKNRLYPKETLQFDKKINEYRENKLSLSELINYLYQKDNNLLNKYSNLRLTSQLIHLEDSVDFEKIETERNTFLKDIEKKLPKEELEELVKKSLLYKLGKIPSSSYYSYLQQFISNEDINRYPNFYRYIKINKQHTRINEDKLFSELDEAIEAIYTSHINNTNTEKLHSIDNSLRILNKLTNLEVTRDEFSAYRNSKWTPTKIANFLNIKARVEGIKLPYELQNKEFVQKNDEFFKTPEQFYEYALKRDKALVKNLSGKMKETEKDKAAIIIGGFHSDGVRKLLEEEGIRVVEITPSITKEDIEARKVYLNRIMDENINPDAILNSLDINSLCPSIITDVATWSREYRAIIDEIQDDQDPELYPWEVTEAKRSISRELMSLDERLGGIEGDPATGNYSNRDIARILNALENIAGQIQPKSLFSAKTSVLNKLLKDLHDIILSQLAAEYDIPEAEIDLLYRQIRTAYQESFPSTTLKYSKSIRFILDIYQQSKTSKKGTINPSSIYKALERMYGSNPIVEDRYFEEDFLNRLLPGYEDTLEEFASDFEARRREFIKRKDPVTRAIINQYANYSGIHDTEVASFARHIAQEEGIVNIKELLTGSTELSPTFDPEDTLEGTHTAFLDEGITRAIEETLKNTSQSRILPIDIYTALLEEVPSAQRSRISTSSLYDIFAEITKDIEKIEAFIEKAEKVMEQRIQQEIDIDNDQTGYILADTDLLLEDSIKNLSEELNVPTRYTIRIIKLIMVQEEISLKDAFEQFKDDIIPRIFQTVKTIPGVNKSIILNASFELHSGDIRDKAVALRSEGTIGEKRIMADSVRGNIASLANKCRVHQKDLMSLTHAIDNRIRNIVESSPKKGELLQGILVLAKEISPDAVSIHRIYKETSATNAAPAVSQLDSQTWETTTYDPDDDVTYDLDSGTLTQEDLEYTKDAISERRKEFLEKFQSGKIASLTEFDLNYWRNLIATIINGFSAGDFEDFLKTLNKTGLVEISNLEEFIDSYHKLQWWQNEVKRIDSPIDSAKLKKISEVARNAQYILVYNAQQFISENFQRISQSQRILSKELLIESINTINNYLAGNIQNDGRAIETISNLLVDEKEKDYPNAPIYVFNHGISLNSLNLIGYEYGDAVIADQKNLFNELFKWNNNIRIVQIGNKNVIIGLSKDPKEQKEQVDALIKLYLYGYETFTDDNEGQDTLKILFNPNTEKLKKNRNKSEEDRDKYEKNERDFNLFTSWYEKRLSERVKSNIDKLLQGELQKSTEAQNKDLIGRLNLAIKDLNSQRFNPDKIEVDKGSSNLWYLSSTDKQDKNYIRDAYELIEKGDIEGYNALIYEQIAILGSEINTLNGEMASASTDTEKGRIEDLIWEAERKKEFWEGIEFGKMIDNESNKLGYKQQALEDREDSRDQERIEQLEQRIQFLHQLGNSINALSGMPDDQKAKTKQIGEWKRLFMYRVNDGVALIANKAINEMEATAQDVETTDERRRAGEIPGKINDSIFEEDIRWYPRPDHTLGQLRYRSANNLKHYIRTGEIKDKDDDTDIEQILEETKSLWSKMHYKQWHNVRNDKFCANGDPFYFFVEQGLIQNNIPETYLYDVRKECGYEGEEDIKCVVAMGGDEHRMAFTDGEGNLYLFALDVDNFQSRDRGERLEETLKDDDQTIFDIHKEILRAIFREYNTFTPGIPLKDRIRRLNNILVANSGIAVMQNVVIHQDGFEQTLFDLTGKVPMLAKLKHSARVWRGGIEDAQDDERGSITISAIAHVVPKDKVAKLDFFKIRNLIGNMDDKAEEFKKAGKRGSGALYTDDFTEIRRQGKIIEDRLNTRIAIVKALLREDPYQHMRSALEAKGYLDEFIELFAKMKIDIPEKEDPQAITKKYVWDRFINGKHKLYSYFSADPADSERMFNEFTEEYLARARQAADAEAEEVDSTEETQSLSISVDTDELPTDIADDEDDSRGLKGKPNSYYTNRIQNALRTGEYASVVYDAEGNVVDTNVIQTQDGVTVAPQEEQLLDAERAVLQSVINSLPGYLKGLLQAEEIRIIFIKGLSPHYGISRKQIYINRGAFKSKKELNIALLHELLERYFIIDEMDDLYRDWRKKRTTDEIKSEINKLAEQIHAWLESNESTMTNPSEILFQWDIFILADRLDITETELQDLLQEGADNDKLVRTLVQAMKADGEITPDEIEMLTNKAEVVASIYEKANIKRDELLNIREMIAFYLTLKDIKTNEMPEFLQRLEAELNAKNLYNPALVSDLVRSIYQMDGYDSNGEKSKIFDLMLLEIRNVFNVQSGDHIDTDLNILDIYKRNKQEAMNKLNINEQGPVNNDLTGYTGLINYLRERNPAVLGTIVELIGLYHIPGTGTQEIYNFFSKADSEDINVAKVIAAIEKIVSVKDIEVFDTSEKSPISDNLEEDFTTIQTMQDEMGNNDIYCFMRENGAVAGGAVIGEIDVLDDLESINNSQKMSGLMKFFGRSYLVLKLQRKGKKLLNALYGYKQAETLITEDLGEDANLGFEADQLVTDAKSLVGRVAIDKNKNYTVAPVGEGSLWLLRKVKNKVILYDTENEKKATEIWLAEHGIRLKDEQYIERSAYDIAKDKVIVYMITNGTADKLNIPENNNKHRVVKGKLGETDSIIMSRMAAILGSQKELEQDYLQNKFTTLYKTYYQGSMTASEIADMVSEITELIAQGATIIIALPPISPFIKVFYDTLNLTRETVAVAA